MATEILFNFYEILVENIFGSILLAIFGVAFVMTLILMITRSTFNFLTYWLVFYLVVMMALYIGGLGLILGFILSFTYFMVGLVRLMFNI